VRVTMSSCKDNGEEASGSAVSSSDVVVAKSDPSDETERGYEQLDNDAHSDFLQHFENEIRISQPDNVSLTKVGGSSLGGGTTVPDSTGIRTSSQLQHVAEHIAENIADCNSPSGLFPPTDDAADVLSTPDPYVVSNFVAGAGADMYLIHPPLSTRIEG